METLNDSILDDFHDITSFDVRSFLSAYISFTDVHYNNIVGYYTGVISTLPTTSINALKKLLNDYRRLNDVIVLNATSLQHYKFWVLTEHIDDIGHALDTANNISRWARAASTNRGYTPQVVTELMLQQGQTLEELERTSVRSTDPNSWVDTALRNELREEDYDADGGQLIKVALQNGASIVMEGVIDNIDEPSKTYGLDIDRYIRIDTTQSDLVVLGYQDTLKQAMSILTGLNVGDDPSFVDRGLKIKGSILGGNVAGIAYPAIFRDLAANFATDDTFKSIAVTDIRREQDAVFLDFTVETRTGDVFSDSAQL